MFDKNLVLTIIEIFISLIVEGIILAMIFQWVANKNSEKQQLNLHNELKDIENQNRFEYEQVLNAINQSRIDIISQIKETKNK